MNHTPDNWIAKPTPFGASVIHEQSGHILATILDDHLEYQADALMMSAAPKMKEALIFAKSVLEKNGIIDISEKMAVEMIDEAIGKSEGKIIIHLPLRNDIKA